MTRTDEREAMRKFFYEAWRKHKENLLVEPIEAMIIDIILQHPEYHALFDNPQKIAADEFKESNPFLHISLHLTIREQINADRPQGIRPIYETLCNTFQDRHTAEHRILEVLEHILWNAKESGKLPDERIYLEMLRGINE